MISASISARRTSGRLISARCVEFHIAGFDGRGIDDGMGVFQIVRIVADDDGNAHRAQALDVGAFGGVRTLNLVAQIVHDLGDAAHADAADADEVNGADVERNARLVRASSCAPSQAASTRSARRAVASGLAKAARRRRAFRKIVGRSKMPSRACRPASPGVRSVCAHAPAAAGIGQRIGVGRLVVVERMRQRHQDGRSADRRASSLTVPAPERAIDQMRRRHARRQIPEESRQFGLHAHRGIGCAHRFEIFGAALLHDFEPRAQIRAAAGRLPAARSR